MFIQNEIIKNNVIVNNVKFIAFLTSMDYIIFPSHLVFTRHSNTLSTWKLGQEVPLNSSLEVVGALPFVIFKGKEIALGQAELSLRRHV